MTTNIFDTMAKWKT